jgi:hypothetical protein
MVALVVDSYPVANGDRVLVTGQTVATQNGVYVVTNSGSGIANWVLTRAADFSGVNTKPGTLVFVGAGGSGLYANTSWIQTTVGTGTNGALVIDTDAAAFVLGNTVAYSFLPGAAVYVVSASTFGVAKATITTVGMSQSAVNTVTVSYNVTYLNPARFTGTVDSSQVFATVDAALAAYKPQIT